MRKILYITNGINGSGGLERVLSIKTAVLVEQYGYEVHILVLNGACDTPFYTFAPAIRMHSVPVGGHPLQYIQQYRKGIQDTVQKIQPDLVSVCDDGLKGFFVPRLLRKTGIPVIYERHASILIDQQQGLINRIAGQLMRRLSGSFDAFVVLTRNNMKEWGGDNLKVIPNPLTFYPKQQATLTSQKVIAVGSHAYNKGYDLLLKVWQKVKELYPEWQLHIYGRMDAGRTYPVMSQQLDLEGVVFFHEPDPDIMQRYLESSIMVLPSRSEGFGMVLIEAMACGLPCVSFDCPSGPRDIIAHGEDGFLVPPEDIPAMAARLAELMHNSDLRVQMGQVARKHVQRFQPEQVIGQWDALFKQLMK